MEQPRQQSEAEQAVLPPWFVWHFSLRPEAPGAGDASFLALLRHFARHFRLSRSQIEQLCKMAKDLSDWREVKHLKNFLRAQLENRERAVAAGGGLRPQQRKQAFAELESFYQSRKQVLPNFQRSAPRPKVPQYRFEVLTDPASESGAGPCSGGSGTEPRELRSPRVLGLCPVASQKTRCCNLLTLDAIRQCGFGCSYCAIQHFYDEKAIQVHDNFARKLEKLELDPEQWYHIGTGQASDSLLWAEDLDVLEPLLHFARRYPRVILELKSKSANVQGLLQQDLPPNILFTWSLNPDSFIEHEELLTAPLDARLRAARVLADRGAKVGFHFHPIVRYQGWKTEYRQLAERLAGLFHPSEVVTVSLGTLTFSKAALKTIRHKALQTQILRFPMEEIAGKFSYPYKVKREMFRHVYQALGPWHGAVFFYLCMEDPALWPEIFGSDYHSNQDFEQDMLQSYAQKMGLL